jgi:hypothetical protein
MSRNETNRRRSPFARRVASRAQAIDSTIRLDSGRRAAARRRRSVLGRVGAYVNGAALARASVSNICFSEYAMDKEVETIVECTIRHTRAILTISPDRWDHARRGMLTIRDSLAARAPGHPALERLTAFVRAEDRWRAGWRDARRP